MISEFKQFALKSNFLDMAVGIVIGAAVTTVVNSLVNDILMPPIGFLIGGVDFSDIVIQLGNSDATINIGLFINAIINFLIVAFVMFLIVRQYNRLFVKKEEAKPAESSTDEKLLVTLNRLNETLDEMRK
ncbi:large-conductance mechanosensitive channel protein MscL [Anaerolineales bacterium]